MSGLEILDFILEKSTKTLFIYSAFFMLVSKLLSWKASATPNPHNYLAPLSVDLCNYASTGFMWAAMILAIIAVFKKIFKPVSDRNL